VTASDCLTPDELAALASGGLTGDRLERVAAHLDVCPTCLAAVPASGPADPLVAVLCLDAALAAGPAAGPAGRYEVVRLHAAGGLGEVHIAEDTELGRRVALKRLRPARADDPASRSRFLREAAITARLEHPGVVPVHGLVRDPAGRPHYAMRLIAGESLQDAIRAFHAAGAADRLALRGLLTRFVTVCQTVAYAHSKGVVHRDLKPANVMLGEYGETLVVDWGLAKVLGPGGLAEADEGRLDPTETLPANDTRTDAVVGTPGYMSPEQAAGRTAAVGPASDVYALGATLHAILTGRPPGDGRKDSRRVSRAAPRALLAVCRKATAERPADRYAAAGEVGAEVERWLAGEPVAAYPEGWASRALRWARRHRVVVAGLLVAAVVGGSVGAWGLREATDRRAEQGRLELKDREAVERALAAVPGLVAGWRFQEAVGLLEQTRLGLSEFAPGETRNRLEEALDDVRLAETLDTIHLEQSELVEGKLPNPARAAVRYESAFQAHGLDCPDGDARELGARLARSIVRDALIGALDEWAYGERDRRLREKVTRVARAADPDPAWRDSFRDALVRVDRARVKELAAGADVKRLPPATIVTLGLALGGSTPEAEKLFRAAQSHHPADFWINCYLGHAIYTRANDRDAAARSVSHYRAGLAARPETAVVYNDLALALRKQGEFAEAAAAAHRAVELTPKSAVAWNTLGTVLSAGGDAAGAERAYRRAIDLYPAFALAHRNLGSALKARGNLSESEKEYRRAIDSDPKNAPAHNNLGNLLLDQGNRAEAEKELRQAIELDPRMAPAHNNLAGVLHARGDVAGAEAEVRLALELDPNYADAHNNLGNLLLERGDPAGAEKEYRRAVELDPRHGRANYSVAQALLELGRFEEARDFARQALTLFPPGKRGHEDANRRLQQCERLLVLERRLSAVLRGDEAQPADPADRLGLAEVAARKRRYAVAARLYAQSPGDQGPTGPQRYHAACAAALAGCGKGTDEVGPSERARWRQQALEWLRAEFKVMSPRLAAGVASLREQTRRILLHWQSDPRLAGVRDSASLAALSSDEREAWQQFWADLGAALQSGGQ
jgi:serine/threonine-protein kinase